MSHLGTLQNFAFDQDVDDIRGTAIYGLKGDKLGKIADVIFDHGTGEIKYAVVDTGGFLSHKKFLVPADRIHADPKDRDAFQIELTKDHIEKKFPRYNENKMQSAEDWSNFEREYKRVWDVDPVQHREDRVDLDVTPATVNAGVSPTGAPRASDVPTGSLGEEVTEEYTSLEEPKPHADVSSIDDQEIAEEDIEGRFTPSRLAGKFPEAMQSPGKIQMSPAHPPDRPLDQGADVGQWHPRMRQFEDVLRKNCVDVTASCPSCAPAKGKAA